MWDVSTAFVIAVMKLREAERMKHGQAELFNQSLKTSQLNQAGSVIIHPR